MAFAKSVFAACILAASVHLINTSDDGVDMRSVSLHQETQLYEEHLPSFEEMFTESEKQVMGFRELKSRGSSSKRSKSRTQKKIQSFMTSDSDAHETGGYSVVGIALAALFGGFLLCALALKGCQQCRRNNRVSEVTKKWQEKENPPN